MAFLFPFWRGPSRAVFRLYEVQSRVWSLGQRPGLYIIDRDGMVRFAHVGAQQWDIPSDEWVLGRLEKVEGEWNRREGMGG